MEFIAHSSRVTRVLARLPIRRIENEGRGLAAALVFEPAARPERDVVLDRGCASGRGRSFPAQEVKQRCVDLLWVGPPDVVRAVGDLDNGQVVDQSLVTQSRGCGRERQGTVG